MIPEQIETRWTMLVDVLIAIENRNIHIILRKHLPRCVYSSREAYKKHTN